MAKPHLVVRREDELGGRKSGFKQGAHFAAMPLVDGYQHVVENGESEAFSKQVAHEREIQAEPHPILMSFAVIGTRREAAAAIEIHIEAELADRRNEVRSEVAFVVLVDLTIIIGKRFLHLMIDGDRKSVV